ncbi:MAG: hypothetical protein GY757_17845 [bacterium]|nr:hypothetical protein [bacterium]
MEIFEKRQIADGLHRIRLRLVNSKGLPSMSYHAKKVKLYPQDILKVSGKSASVKAGGRLNDVYANKVSYKEFRPETQFLTVPAFGHVEYQFLVSGSGPITISYSSRHAKNVAKTIELK